MYSDTEQSHTSISGNEVWFPVPGTAKEDIGGVWGIFKHIPLCTKCIQSLYQLDNCELWLGNSGS